MTLFIDRLAAYTHTHTQLIKFANLPKPITMVTKEKDDDEEAGKMIKI